jgi:hypothetical protein
MNGWICNNTVARVTHISHELSKLPHCHFIVGVAHVEDLPICSGGILLFHHI